MKRLCRRFTFVPADVRARLMDVDYGRNMALVAAINSEGGERFVGVARYGSTERADRLVSCAVMSVASGRPVGRSAEYACPTQLPSISRVRASQCESTGSVSGWKPHRSRLSPGLHEDFMRKKQSCSLSWSFEGLA